MNASLRFAVRVERLNRGRRRLRLVAGTLVADSEIRYIRGILLRSPQH
jgi:hypothetical protein